MKNNQHPTHVFEAFSLNFKNLIEKGILLANEKDDKKFKCLQKANEDALRCIEIKISSFQYLFKKAMAAPQLQNYKERDEIISLMENEINEFFEDLVEHGKEDEILCLGIIRYFIDCFKAEKSITYETMLHILLRKNSMVELGDLCSVVLNN